MKAGITEKFVGELSAYDNHPADMGTELYDREKDFALEEHADSELNKVNAALQAMEEGNYGKCKVCGIEIPYERLEARPNDSILCHNIQMSKAFQLIALLRKTYLNLLMAIIFSIINFVKFVDNEDSFQEVARYGTSETPADLKGDYEDYNSLYNVGHDDEGFTEDY